VKRERKERVGSRRRRRETGNPFELSAAIHAKLEKLFALSREAPAPSLPEATRRRADPAKRRLIGGESRAGRPALRVDRHVRASQFVQGGTRGG